MKPPMRNPTMPQNGNPLLGVVSDDTMTDLRRANLTKLRRARERLGATYLLHPDNRVTRRTPFPTPGLMDRYRKRSAFDQFTKDMLGRVADSMGIDRTLVSLEALPPYRSFRTNALKPSYVDPVRDLPHEDDGYPD